MTAARVRLLAMICLMLVVRVPEANSQLDRQASARSARAVMVGCETLLAGKDFESNDYWRSGCGSEVLEVWNTGGSLKMICSPHGVTLIEAVRVVVDFISARPERMDERFSTLALEALHNTWPCK